MDLWQLGEIRGGDGERGIRIKDDHGNRVLALSQDDNGRITFREQLEGEYGVEMSKSDARKALMEAVAWIDRGCPNEARFFESESQDNS